jgi:AcrR family transcriptional regulator
MQGGTLRPRVPRTEPRKAASQARARQTVDALVRATAQVLVRDGYERTSTNKIARLAGVSIGSLYQYFPGKEALVVAVIDRHQTEMMQKVHGALVKVRARSVQTAARELVEVMIEAHRIDPKLHRVLAEQIPRVGRLENVAALEREGTALLAAYLNAHRQELAVADSEQAAFVCVTAAEALTHAAVVNRSSVLPDEEAERLVGHVTRLVLRYLCP